MRQWFVSAVAAHQNLGDLVIRRTLIDWLHGHGNVNVLTQDMPAPFLDALDLDRPDITKVPTRAEFIRQMLLAPRTARPTAVYAPGEYPQSASPRIWATALSNILTTLLLRAVSGGSTYVLGRSYAGSNPISIKLHAAHIRITDGTWLRDRSASALFRTSWTPDLALFARPSPSTAHRDLLALSLRSDSPLQPLALKLAAGLARDLDLSPIVVTQVRTDSQTNGSIAQTLRACDIPWTLETHSHQLSRVTTAYRSAAVVASDRLHVLLLGLVHGAVPVALCDDGRPKLRNHFTSLGLERLCISSIDGIPDLTRYLQEPSLRSQIASLHIRWREQLSAVRHELLSS